MNQENKISYRLDINYIKQEGEVKSEYFFKKIYNLNYLGKPTKKILYDSKNKIYFESNELVISGIEIETEDIYVRFHKKYKKLEDFYRRVNYRYDWIQISLNSEKGSISSILNTDELKKNWNEMKSLLIRDYEGLDFHSYIENLSELSSSEIHFQDIFNQPFYFGLLFPPIPHRHQIKWSTSRNYTIWENSEVVFSETIKFDRKENSTRYYLLEGEIISNHNADLMTYEGNISYSSLDKEVKLADLSISYKLNDTINSWTFKLKRIREYKQ